MIKKMSEAFELPIKGFELEYLMSETTGDDDELIAHAINHVDSLANALEALIPYCYGGNEEAMNAWAAAKDAINAYRGEK